jgi:hypothetical protein
VTTATIRAGGVAGSTLGIYNVPICERHAFGANRFVADAVAAFLAEGFIAAAGADMSSARSEPVARRHIALAVPHGLALGFKAADRVAPLALAILRVAFLAAVAPDGLTDVLSDRILGRSAGHVLPVELARRSHHPSRQ